MLRYFRLIQIAFVILCYSALIGLINTLLFFKELAGANVPEPAIVYPFLLNLVLTVSLVFSVILSRRYLYNFNYFSLPVAIPEDDNLMPTAQFKYEPDDYDDVPEPYKLRLAVYPMLAFSAVSIFYHIFLMLFPLFSFASDSGLMQIIHESYLVYKSVPVFYGSLIPTWTMLFYSLTMFYQIRHYKRYYTILVSDPPEEIDLIHELHENK
jgi:hypothetical protein